MVSWLLYAGVAVVAYRLAKGPVTKPPKKAKARREESELDKAYRVLAVDAAASDGEVRSAYQEKVRAYHPDRVAGAAPEIQELAETRTKELNGAYATIRSAREGNLPPRRAQ